MYHHCKSHCGICVKSQLLPNKKLSVTREKYTMTQGIGKFCMIKKLILNSLKYIMRCKVFYKGMLMENVLYY